MQMQMQMQHGPNLKAQATYLMNQHQISPRRVGDILSDFYGADLSFGSIMQWRDEAYSILAPLSNFPRLYHPISL